MILLRLKYIFCTSLALNFSAIYPMFVCPKTSVLLVDQICENDIKSIRRLKSDRKYLQISKSGGARFSCAAPEQEKRDLYMNAPSPRSNLVPIRCPH